MIEDEQNGPIRFPPTPTSPEPLLHLTTNNYTPRFNAKPYNPFEDKKFFLGEQCSNPMALNAWTASNNFVKQFLPSSVSPNDVFCLVPGRLGIPNVGKR
uniref:Uncharacterized protein n=1 Tax=Ciona savignyi TaxID=51511 RepID=H2YSM2_CIOSA